MNMIDDSFKNIMIVIYNGDRVYSTGLSGCVYKL